MIKAHSCTLIGVAFVAGCMATAHAADPAGRSVQFQKLQARFTIPPGWEQTVAPKSPSNIHALSETLAVRPVRGPHFPGRGINLMAITAEAADAPEAVLERLASVSALLAADLCSTGRLIKRESATLWGRPSLKLAVRCTPDDALGTATNVVYWIATDGRRTLILQANAEPADWPATWKAFQNVTDSLVWPNP
ncbi:MAG TPA: hypothetical protein VF595_17570 [Tepidisphaeraceae bacterium]